MRRKPCRALQPSAMNARALVAAICATIVLSGLPALLDPAGASEPSATESRPLPVACTSSVGPGIPPPASVPAKAHYYHAAWYGQSGYMTLCPGDTATATVAIYNSGEFGWVSGKAGETAYLGTTNPSP